MRKFSALLLILICLFALCACGGDESGIEPPEDMQVVSVSERDGYILFGPEGWIIANQGEVCATYVTAINNTSVTFTKIDMPTAEFTKDTVRAYFGGTMAAFPYEWTASVPGDVCNFGKPDAGADLAYKFVYTYTYGEYKVSVMQIIAKRGGDRFLLTYTSYGEVTDEASYYRTYLDKAQMVIDNLTFTEKKSEGEAQDKEYTKDADGYILVSDEAVAGFSFYVPIDYKVVDSSAFVTVKASENAVITLAKAGETGVGILDYLASRHDDMSAITEDFTDIKVTVTTAVNTDTEYFENWSITTLPELDEGLKFGNLTAANTVAYEYAYTYLGVRYHVYQVLGVDRFSGYVLTYTATEEEYSTHLGELERILEKVRF